MKFKDNPFYKAYELKTKHNDFMSDYEDNGGYLVCSYELEAGICVVLELLVESIKGYARLKVEIWDDVNKRGISVGGPRAALDYLKNKDYNEIEGIRLTYGYDDELEERNFLFENDRVEEYLMIINYDEFRMY